MIIKKRSVKINIIIKWWVNITIIKRERESIYSRLFWHAIKFIFTLIE
jgi:hypothetical protein